MEARTTHTLSEVRPLPFPAARPPFPEDRPGGRTIALIAHDARKGALLTLARAHTLTLMRRRILVTATTGKLLSSTLGLRVEMVASGPQGGDLQIGARIVEGAVDAVIFLRDPLTAHPHEPDIQALLKVCDVHEVPVATNVAAGEILLRFEAERDWWTDDEDGVSGPRGPQLGLGLADASGYGLLPFDDDRAVP